MSMVCTYQKGNQHKLSMKLDVYEVNFMCLGSLYREWKQGFQKNTSDGENLYAIS